MNDNTVIITKVQDAFWQKAEQLMLHHTNPWELDEALEDFGYGMGPCAAQDLMGLDHVLARRATAPNPILPRMVAEGRHGKKTGVGYYRYPGGGGAVIDPLIEDLIREEAWFAKIERSEIAPDDLVAQMNAALTGMCDDAAFGADGAEMLQKAVHFPPHRLGELDVRT